MEILLILLILTGALWLFVTEKLPPALVSLLVLCTVAIAGLIGVGAGIISPSKWVSVDEALASFRNPAVIAVAGMFVLSAGLEKSGVLDAAVRLLGLTAKRPTLLLGAVMALTAGLSAFVNNTAAVAALMPAIVTLCARNGYAPSRFLIPLSYASQFGGVCTLIGTSTNLLVNSVAVNAGQPAFGFFEFSPLGMCMVGVGMVFILTLGRTLLPLRESDTSGTTRARGDFLIEVIPGQDCPLSGQKADAANLLPEACGKARVAAIVRRETALTSEGQTVSHGDLLRLRADLDAVEYLRRMKSLTFPHGAPPAPAGKPDEDPLTLVQAIVSPGSRHAGRSPVESGLHDSLESALLGIRRHAPHPGEIILTESPLMFGDELLLLTRKSRLGAIREHADLIVLEEKEARTKAGLRTAVAVGIFVAVVAATLITGTPIALCALAGAVAMVAVGCLRMDQAIRAVDWQVLLMLAGLLPLGLCLEKSGAAALLADNVASLMEPLGPLALLAAVYLLTAVLTEFMSNNATAVLLTPVAITAATKLGADPRPFIVAVAFAASTSFATPVGYQTNAMVYAPGGYKFADFLRAGIPLNLLFWLLAILLIPVFWPF